MRRQVVVLAERTKISGVWRDKGEVVVVDEKFPKSKIRRVIRWLD